MKKYIYLVIIVCLSVFLFACNSNEMTFDIESNKKVTFLNDEESSVEEVPEEGEEVLPKEKSECTCDCPKSHKGHGKWDKGPNPDVDTEEELPEEGEEVLPEEKPECTCDCHKNHKEHNKGNKGHKGHGKWDKGPNPDVDTEEELPEEGEENTSNEEIFE